MLSWITLWIEIDAGNQVQFFSPHKQQVCIISTLTGWLLNFSKVYCSIFRLPAPWYWSWPRSLWTMQLKWTYQGLATSKLLIYTSWVRTSGNLHQVLWATGQLKNSCWWTHGNYVCLFVLVLALQGCLTFICLVLLERTIVNFMASGMIHHNWIAVNKIHDEEIKSEQHGEASAKHHCTVCLRVKNAMEIGAQRVALLDRVARCGFPLVFLGFNICYWVFYTRP